MSAVISYSYQWFQDGTLQTSQTTSSIASANTTKGETWMVHVTPHDGTLDGPYGQAEITIGNSPPTISSISILPTTGVYNDSMLSSSATATDPDETPTISYEWFINNVVIQTGSTIDLGSYSLSPATTIICTATATDSNGVFVSDTSSVGIENRIPVVDSVTLNPSVVYTNDTITATILLSDPDAVQSITASYEWHVINNNTGIDSIVQSGANDTLSGSLHFQKYDGVYVSITPNDGIDAGNAFSSNSITIINTPPTSASISISPNPAEAELDDLICTVDTPSSDDDGDILLYTYVWEDSTGTAVQTTSQTSQTQDILSGTSTIEGTYTCTVTPTDSIMDGTSSSTSVLVQDLACEEIGVYADFETGSKCPVVYYDMETLDQSGYVEDLIGGYSLTTVGSPTAGVAGITGTTYSINSSSDYFLSLGGYPSQLQGNSAKSISAWAYLGAKGGDGDGAHPLVSFGAGNPCTSGAFAVGYSTETANDNPIAISCGNDIRAGGSWELAKWYHIVSTFDGSTFILYINGTFIDSKVTTLNIGTHFHAIGIGVDTWWSGAYHYLTNGRVDEIKIYDYALSSAEVSDLYNIDADQDGSAVWEDCNDADPSVQASDIGVLETCPAKSCKDILDAGYSTTDGFYWLDPTGSSPMEVYCDMTTDGGGWALVGVALVANRGQSGWNDNTDLAPSRFGQMNDHWHYSASTINALASEDEFRAICFDSNNYTRYWFGVSNYQWSAVTSASSTWDGYPQTGNSYATVWAPHHYGLVSGNNETDTLITSHSGNEWACGGNTGPNGEGYTGRGGISNFRLWVQ